MYLSWVHFFLLEISFITVLRGNLYFLYFLWFALLLQLYLMLSSYFLKNLQCYVSTIKIKITLWNRFLKSYLWGFALYHHYLLFIFENVKNFFIWVIFIRFIIFKIIWNMFLWASELMIKFNPINKIIAWALSLKNTLWIVKIFPGLTTKNSKYLQK